MGKYKVKAQIAQIVWADAILEIEAYGPGIAELHADSLLSSGDYKEYLKSFDYVANIQDKDDAKDALDEEGDRQFEIESVELIKD